VDRINSFMLDVEASDVSAVMSLLDALEWSLLTEWYRRTLAHDRHQPQERPDLPLAELQVLAKRRLTGEVTRYDDETGRYTGHRHVAITERAMLTPGDEASP